jgi:hypothetical protein
MKGLLKLSIKDLLRLYEGLLRLIQGTVKTLLRLYLGSIKALLKLY